MKRYFLGVDQGTTGTTALLINENWEVAAVKKCRALPNLSEAGLGWKHDPVEIFGRQLQSAIASVIAQEQIDSLADLYR